MSDLSDLSNVIPINIKLMEQLKRAIKGLEKESICLDQEFTSILITKEGFMKTIKGFGKLPRIRIPKKVELSFQPTSSESSIIEKMPEMEFYLDRVLPDGTLWYREI